MECNQSVDWHCTLLRPAFNFGQYFHIDTDDYLDNIWFAEIAKKKFFQLKLQFLCHILIAQFYSHANEVLKCKMILFVYMLKILFSIVFDRKTHLFFYLYFFCVCMWITNILSVLYFAIVWPSCSVLCVHVLFFVSIADTQFQV